MKPSIGRIVHYVSYGTPGGEFGKACRAAVITEVTSDRVIGLCVLNPSGLFFNTGISLEEDNPNGYTGGTWHWPERVG